MADYDGGGSGRQLQRLRQTAMVSSVSGPTGWEESLRVSGRKLEFGLPAGDARPRSGSQPFRLGRHVIAYRHCDPRFPFLWSDSAQPPARWHSAGEGPANYFADTPVGAWAEFIRHEGITDPADLPGVQRSLWAVEIPDGAYEMPGLDSATLLGGLTSYIDCQNEAHRLRAGGADRLEAPSAALLPGDARGWVASPNIQPAPRPRRGKVWVWFGPRPDFVAWPVVEAGAPPSRVLPLVRHFTFGPSAKPATTGTPRRQSGPRSRQKRQK